MFEGQENFGFGVAKVFKGKGESQNQGHKVVERSIFKERERDNHQDRLYLEATSIETTINFIFAHKIDFAFNLDIATHRLQFNPTYLLV
jgi:hypothetical protein